MTHRFLRTAALLSPVLALTAGCERTVARAEAPDPDTETSVEITTHVAATSPIEAGRYLIIVAGCNDCHTDGWMQTEGRVPEEQWLTGSSLGWRGPWGTTYPANLRLRASEMSEDEWVAQLHARNAQPPMPWMNVKHLSDADARAMYRYIRSLGPVGERMPAAVPPDQEPTTPYLSLVPVTPADTP